MKAKKLEDIIANEDNVINTAIIKYNIFKMFSITIFLNVKKSYIHPKNPVYFPSFFFAKNVKYNTIPPITATTAEIIIQTEFPEEALLDLSKEFIAELLPYPE